MSSPKHADSLHQQFVDALRACLGLAPLYRADPPPTLPDYGVRPHDGNRRAMVAPQSDRIGPQARRRSYEREAALKRLARHGS